MVSSPKPPAPPDPQKTADAQAAANKETAIAQAGLNMTNQVGPYGQVSYRQIGTWEDGTPRFEQTTSLDPAQQKLLDQQNALSEALNRFAIGQTGRIEGALSTPFDLNGNEAVEGRLFELGRKRLDPVLDQRSEAMRTRLANQGITAGTEAYDREMTRLMQGENDAYNQLALTGRQQALTELLTERNQPINEIGALMSGGQVTMPQFGPTTQTGIASPDIMGMENANYAGRMAQYQAKLNSRDQLLGGLFGLGSSAAMAYAMSDARVKTDVRRVGTLDNGLPVYAFRYVWGGPMQIGVMAQDVEQVHPEAVMEVDGIKMVDYGQAVGEIGHGA